jgi:hypothetical protein
MKCYWAQNNPADFTDILSKFIICLCERGHKIEALVPLITQAALTLKHHYTITKQPNNSDQNTLYIHWPYHPHGIQRHTIRQLFNNILQPHIPFDKIQVAISRPKNLKDILTRTSLTLPNDLSLDTMIAKNRHIKKFCHAATLRPRMAVLTRNILIAELTTISEH